SRTHLLARLTARRQCATCGTIYNLLSRPSSGGLYCESDGGTLEQRDDDTEAIILRRLTDFETSCARLVEYYRDGDYHRIDGERESDLVSTDLLAIVTPLEACAAA